MKVKWSPCAGRPPQKLAVVGESTISIDGTEYNYPAGSPLPDNVALDTGGAIVSVARDQNGVLCLTVTRFYPAREPIPWDDGQYHDYGIGVIQ